MKILTINDPKELATLHSISVPVNNYKHYAPVCLQLKAFVENPANKAIGLAAVQIGVPVRIFAARISVRPGFRTYVKIFINPEIEAVIPPNQQAFETCLSEPGIERIVPRSKHVWVKYLNDKGLRERIGFSDIDARVIQHEMDHLDGILLKDRS